MKIVVIIQARTASTRFPRKILQKVFGKTMLELQLERVLRAKLPSHVVIATTTNFEDDEIYNLGIGKGYLVFRGHPTDLLDRHYRIATAFDADVVVKIPSDCPLIDHRIIDKVIQFYLDNQSNYDFVSNLHPATYPDGNDVEVIPFKILQTAWKEAEKQFELEHTTPFIWDNPKRFRIGNVDWESALDYSMSHRFTLDYPEDYEFIKTIYEELYPYNPDFTLDNIIRLLELNPEIKKINEKYAGVNWYRHNLEDLRTIKNEMTLILND